MTRIAIGSLLALLTLLVVTTSTHAGLWNVGYRNSISLDTSVVSVAELSGVTYVGPAPTSGLQRFAAVQDSGGQVITLDVGLDVSGNVVSAAAVESLSLANSLDFEGIAYTDATQNSAFISEEGGPGVREYDLTSGALLDTLSIPSVFATRAGNRGFESLARSADGSVMWTANEEALTVDGALSTPLAGSTVRLLRLDESGGSYSAGSQFAYLTEPIHGIDVNGSRSGVSDLVVLPDGTVLALERSAAAALPPFLTSIYEVDFAGATDISASNFDAGLLADPNYTPVTKELLWSGAADGSQGQNFEGLALGPQLANGNWVLLGVSDDGGGTNSSTIATWELSANPSADFNEDGFVGGLDFLSWQRGIGTSIGASFSQGDANRDGAVDFEDLAIWEAEYGTAAFSVQAVPEISAWLLLVISATILGLHRTFWFGPEKHVVWRS